MTWEILMIFEFKLKIFNIVFVHLFSYVWHFATPYSTPGFPVLHHVPEFVQTHVHWVGDAIHPLGSLFLIYAKFFTIFTIIFANQNNMIQSACVYCDGIKTDFSLVTVKVAQLCPTLQPHGLYSPWDSLGLLFYRIVGEWATQQVRSFGCIN